LLVDREKISIRIVYTIQRKRQTEWERERERENKAFKNWGRDHRQVIREIRKMRDKKDKYSGKSGKRE